MVVPGLFRPKVLRATSTQNHKYRDSEAHRCDDAAGPAHSGAKVPAVQSARGPRRRRPGVPRGRSAEGHRRIGSNGPAPVGP
jgi:hypothetical protein